MELQRPAPDPITTQPVRQRFGPMAVVLIGLVVLLLVTLAAWMLLWGGGIREAVTEDAKAPAGQRP